MLTGLLNRPMIILLFRGKWQEILITVIMPVHVSLWQEAVWGSAKPSQQQRRCWENSFISIAEMYVQSCCLEVLVHRSDIVSAQQTERTCFTWSNMLLYDYRFKKKWPHKINFTCLLWLPVQFYIENLYKNTFYGFKHPSTDIYIYINDLLTP